MPLKESEIRKLIKLVEESDIDEIEVWRWGTRIRIRKGSAGHGSSAVTHAAGTGSMPHIVAPPKRVSEPASAEEPQELEELYEIRSPMVGTFYRAPTPDTDPFVKEGDFVSPGQVLCIIEAMKVMNQIESDVSGQIAKVLAEDANPVEYNQRLFLIKPN